MAAMTGRRNPGAPGAARGAARAWMTATLGAAAMTAVSARVDHVYVVFSNHLDIGNLDTFNKI